MSTVESGVDWDTLHIWALLYNIIWFGFLFTVPHLTLLLCRLCTLLKPTGGGQLAIINPLSDASIKSFSHEKEHWPKRRFQEVTWSAVARGWKAGWKAGRDILFFSICSSSWCIQSWYVSMIINNISNIDYGLSVVFVYTLCVCMYMHICIYIQDKYCFYFPFRKEKDESLQTI